MIIVLLPHFADWELAFAAATLNDQIENIKSRYFVKTVGLTREPVKSIGGLTVLPDYTIESAPEDYAALLLIGGMSWCTKKREQTDMAKRVIPLVQSAVDSGAIVGAICDATTFLGANGWLNSVKHTSNTLEDLKRVAGAKYTNSKEYIEEQAVRGDNIITANGTAYLEFARELLCALEAYPKKAIDAHYDFYKKGYYRAMEIHGIAKGI